jgi:hypothetical protein|nr:MAG TPA_asm: hypothetical protein [Bacteriophage sp.]
MKNNTTHILYPDGLIVKITYHSWFKSIIDLIKNRPDFDMDCYIPVIPYSKSEKSKLYELLRRNINLDFNDIMVLVNSIRSNSIQNSQLDCNPNYVNTTKKKDIDLLRTSKQV